MTIRQIPLLPSPSCTHDCQATASFADSLLLGIEGKLSPICPTCLGEFARRVDPERIVMPHRPPSARRRVDGDGPAQLEPCTWSEALDRLQLAIEDLLEGRRELTWLSCAEQPGLIDVIPRRLSRLTGGATFVRRKTPRDGIAALVRENVIAEDRIAVEDLGDADVIICWGCDPAENDLPAWRSILRARRRGGRLLVVDPRGSATSRRADLHLAARPSTDTALALGLLAHVPEKRDAGLESWSIERAARACALREDDVRTAESWIASSRSCALVLGAGIARYENAPDAIRAIAMLARNVGAKVVAPDERPNPAAGAAEPAVGARLQQISSAEWIDSLGARDPARQIVIIEGGDPLVSWAGHSQLAEFLDRCHFVAWFATHWSAVRMHADLVLPSAHHLEMSGAVGQAISSGTWCGRAAHPVRREARDIVTVWSSVAQKIGWPLEWFPADSHQLLEEAEITERDDHACHVTNGTRLPKHREAGEGPRTTPELFRIFQLQLVAGSEEPQFGPPLARMSPAEAARRGLDAAALVTIFNDRGRVAARLEPDPSQPDGIVSLPHRSCASLLAPAIGAFGAEASGGCLVDVSCGDEPRQGR